MDQALIKAGPAVIVAVGAIGVVGVLGGLVIVKILRGSQSTRKRLTTIAEDIGDRESEIAGRVERSLKKVGEEDVRGVRCVRYTMKVSLRTLRIRPARITFLVRKRPPGVPTIPEKRNVYCYLGGLLTDDRPDIDPNEKRVSSRFPVHSFDSTLQHARAPTGRG